MPQAAPPPETAQVQPAPPTQQAAPPTQAAPQPAAPQQQQQSAPQNGLPPMPQQTAPQQAAPQPAAPLPAQQMPAQQTLPQAPDMGAPPNGFVPAGNDALPSMMGDDTTPMIQPSPEGYTYDPTNRRDPFKPYGTSQASQAPGPKEDDRPAPTDPLQMFDVSQFRLMGIVWQVRNPKAVVRDPVGKMHLIYKDTKIGRNSGFVAAIREGEVLVVEPTIGENGMPSAITRAMTLKK